LKDTYAHGASRPYLMRSYHLDAISLVREVETLLGRRLDIRDEDINRVRNQVDYTRGKADTL
jgi:transketolase